MPLPPSTTTFDEELLTWPAPETAEEDRRRVERISAEIAHGFRLLAHIGKAVSFFGSARTPEGHPDYALARSIAFALGEAGFAIITGAGAGIMEAANRGARDAGALSIGLNIELPVEQAANPYVDVQIRFRYFFARKLMYVRYASAFIFSPGGYGTLDELFEALTLIETDRVRDFPVVLVGDGYWDGLLGWLKRSVAGTGKLAIPEFDLIIRSDDPVEICGIVEASVPEQYLFPAHAV